MHSVWDPFANLTSHIRVTKVVTSLFVIFRVLLVQDSE